MIKMKITTKSGDGGETSLFGGRRVSKGSDYMRLLGEIDELQAVLGLCEGTVAERVQDDLYRMMAIVGFEMKCPGSVRDFDESDVEFLEGEMAGREVVFEKLGKFIRPGSTESAARWNLARAVCRRVEREMVAFSEHDLKVPAILVKYLNRLSDLLYVMGLEQEDEVFLENEK